MAGLPTAAMFIKAAGGPRLKAEPPGPSCAHPERVAIGSPKVTVISVAATQVGAGVRSASAQFTSRRACKVVRHGACGRRGQDTGREAAIGCLPF